MSNEPSALVGPDLAAGIAIDSVADGATLLGHAHGEPVVVARQGDDYFAIGATCSHYGGPLAEGLVVDGTIRCPWHHACFSLKTGEALRAPALRAVPCFDVERRGTQLVVLRKREAGSRAPARVLAGRQTPSSVVIVGAGAAGHAAAETLRSEGYAGPITLVGADPALPCDRPNLSKDYLAGTAPEEWIPLRPAEFFPEHAISLRLGTRVERIEPAARQVVLAGGERLSYGALLLATGAEPVHLALPGSELPHVRYLRTLADSRGIIALLGKAKRAVVIGAGFIGLETAAALRSRGLEVDVVGPEARPLERVLGPALGDRVRRIHEAHGVRFHLGTTATSIDERSVTLGSGSSLEADLVVIGVGVRPATGLAESAGIATDRGVLVDERLRTSAPHIFAAGDVARWTDPRSKQQVRIEHWVVAQRQGQLAARAMLGQDVRFDAVPFFWSQHYELAIAYVGHAESWDRIDTVGDVAGGECAVAFRRGQTTLAVASIFRDDISLRAELALERGDQAALQRLVALPD